MSYDEGIILKCLHVKGSQLLAYRPSEGYLSFILTDMEIEENSVVETDEKGAIKLRNYLTEVIGDKPRRELGRLAIRKALPHIPGDMLDHGLFAALKAMGVE